MSTSTTAQRVARDPSAAWWAGEDGVRISDVPRILPPAPNGKRISIATIYRWSLNGLRGVRLRRFKIGSAWHTTRQEIDRWSRALTSLEAVS